MDMRASRTLGLPIVLLTIGSFAPRESEAPSTTTPPDPIAVVQTYCTRCHGADRQKGGLDLAAALEVRPLLEKERIWRSVRARVAGGDMPPRRAKQPSADERATLVAWIDEQLDAFDHSSLDEPGFEPARRLSRVEFGRVLTDLLGVDGTSLARTLPDDLAGSSGFTGSANTLFLQGTRVETFLQIAEAALSPEAIEQITTNALGEEVDAAKLDSEQLGALLQHFLTRAWRRPPTPESTKRIRRAYDAERDLGSDSAAALAHALRVALASPRFLMRVETPGDESTTFRIDAYDLASRLSFFLWASTPDDRLLGKASDGSLFETEVLRQEVDRMLADPRSRSLGTVFALEWLGVDGLGERFRPDPIDNPEMREPRLRAMREETATFVHRAIADDRPISELLSADYSYVNEELTKHYRMRSVRGQDMRRVKMPVRSRGGLLGHASVLMITSDPDRSNPIRRGTWILTELLGKEPPEPPPDAGEIDEELLEEEDLSFAEALAQHRENKSCAICHNEIDPLGLALEGYDQFGRYRRRADAEGVLPGGIAFEGLAGLNRAVLKHFGPEFEAQVIRELLAYALHRDLEYTDERWVLELRDELRRRQGGLGELVHLITTSRPFQFKKSRQR